MKRLLLVIALVLLPAAVFAQNANVDRDVLLTSDGTLYTVESDYAESSDQLNVGSSQILTLTVQSGSNVTKTVVPETMAPGLHRRPALAYDADSKTLFVFWLKAPNAMSSELLVASYQNGKWRAATSIDDKPMTFRYNLRIAVTRRVAEVQKSGDLIDVPMVIVHAVWWEITGTGETARYAMLPVDHDSITLNDPKGQIHDLSDFVEPSEMSSAVPQAYNFEIFRHPAILNSTSSDSIDVFFGDLKSNGFNRTTLRPVISDGRLRIPVGIGKGGRPTRVSVPTNLHGDWNGRIETTSTGHADSNSLLMYHVGEKAVSYMVYSDGKWSPVNTLAINEKLSADAAVTVLNRMMNAND